MKQSVVMKFCLLFVCMLCSSPERLMAQTSQEYRVKAAFLFNFTHYVTWPDTKSEEGAPFVIGIVGDDPFGQSLDETVKGEKVEGHVIEVKRFSSPAAITSCHILFINLADKASIRAVLEKLKGQYVLTVSDISTVEKEGGMIRFVTEKNKTRLRINLRAAKQADIIISSKLLALAEIVEPKND